MFFNNKKHLPLACMIGLTCLVGCSQTSASPGAATHAGRASPADHSSPAQPGDDDDDDLPITHIDCARIFSPADVAGILKGKVTITTYPTRDNACAFESDDGASFNLYSGKGFTEEVEWKDGLANRKGDNKALAGVGDQAFYGNGQLQSRKGGYYCAISGSGGNPPSEALARKLGALCNKIFANR